METYQEEYDRILREIQELKKSRNLSDDERKKMAEMQKRVDALENYANESGRLLARITDLQAEITTDMTKIYQMQQMIAVHSTDNSNLSNDEIQKMRKYLFEITGSKSIIQADESTLKRILEAQAKRYDLSDSVAHMFSAPTKIDELNQLCNTYRELQERFAEEEKARADTSDSRDTGTSNQGKHEKDVAREEEEKKLREQKVKIEELKKLKSGINGAEKELREKRKAIDKNGNVSKEDAEKIKKAQKAFFEEIKKFKDSKAKDLYKELEDDAKGKLGLGIEDKDVERERIRLIIELLKVQIDVLKSELAELMKDPKANAGRIEQIEKELKGLAANLDYWNERYTDTQILSENPKEWKPLSNAQSNVSNGQYVSQPTQSVSNQPVPAGKQLQKTTDFMGRIKDAVQKIKDFYADMASDDKRDLVMEAKAQSYKKKREERINSLNDNNFIGEPVEKGRGDMQYLAFPPAKVVGADFYHTVQIGDKLQYVKEPLADMDFSDDAIKARIYELQEKFGNTARERLGKRIGIVEKYRYDHKKMDNSEKRDYEMRLAYQKFLESPDKILRDFIGESKRNVAKKYKAIKLMCALEAANNVEEAGKACLHGMSKDLFGLGLEANRTAFAYAQLANGSLQNDIEKSDMPIAEKIRENLRISRTARLVQPVGTANPSPQPQPAITPGINQPTPAQRANQPAPAQRANQPAPAQRANQPALAQNANQPAITSSGNKRISQPRNQGKNVGQSQSQQAPVHFVRNERLIVNGGHRTDNTIVPLRTPNTMHRNDEISR